MLPSKRFDPRNRQKRNAALQRIDLFNDIIQSLVYILGYFLMFFRISRVSIFQNDSRQLFLSRHSL